MTIKEALLEFQSSNMDMTDYKTFVQRVKQNQSTEQTPEGFVSEVVSSFNMMTATEQCKVVKECRVRAAHEGGEGLLGALNRKLRRRSAFERIDEKEGTREKQPYPP